MFADLAVHHFEFVLDLVETLINAVDPSVDAVHATVNLVEAAVHLIEAAVHLSGATVKVGAGDKFGWLLRDHAEMVARFPAAR